MCSVDVDYVADGTGGDCDNSTKHSRKIAEAEIAGMCFGGGSRGMWTL